MSSFIEAENGLMINLDKVKTIQRLTDLSTIIHFHLGDEKESLIIDIPFEYFKSLMKLRTETRPEESRQTQLLEKILKTQYTPVP